jgi:Reverse transcriptase (RNA-dependent DNA polymerase)
VQNKTDNFDLKNIKSTKKNRNVQTNIFDTVAVVQNESIHNQGQIFVTNKVPTTKNLCMLRGLIALAKTNRNFKCALFSLDLEKAFHMMNHQYLWRVLVRFGYPSGLINVIKSLYHHAGAGSKILIYGFFTEKIMLSHSVR